MLLVSASEDECSRDAPWIADAAAAVYRGMEPRPALRHERFAGDHALTPKRVAVIVDWVVSRAGAR